MTKHADLEKLHARIVALFAGPLVGVRFPDVDGETLSASARDTRQAEAKVEGLRAQLEDARRILDEEEAKLEARIDRALAYLRVYADGNPALLAEVEAVTEQARPQLSTSAPRRRGRPPKVSEVLALEESAPAPQRNGVHAPTGAEPS